MGDLVQRVRGFKSRRPPPAIVLAPVSRSHFPTTILAGSSPHKEPSKWSAEHSVIMKSSNRSVRAAWGKCIERTAFATSGVQYRCSPSCLPLAAPASGAGSDLVEAGSAPPPSTSSCQHRVTRGTNRGGGSVVSGHIPRPLKLVMKTEWDGPQLGLAGISRVCTGLCYGPSLGLRPHLLPAPIYWANGIASIGPTNRQFAGQCHDEVV